MKTASDVESRPVLMHGDHAALIARLSSLYVLSDEAVAALARVPLRSVQIKRGEYVVREGDSTNQVCLVVDGILASTKSAPDGGRQITALHIKGDVPDLYSLHLNVLDSGLEALTPCRLAFVQHETIRSLCDEHPEITSAFWKMTLTDGSILRAWVLSLGRMEALNRTAHLFCEIAMRFRTVGACEGSSYPFAVPQTDLADILGISPVHVNRSLQELRSRKLVEFDRKALHILNWRELAALADFDSGYLHLEGKPRE